MRDFRDAKAMAQTLRAALATKGLRVTISESLELIAQAFGVADWNTLSAAIRAGAVRPGNNASPPMFPRTATLHRASRTPLNEGTLTRRWSTSCLPSSMTSTLPR